MLLKLFIIFLLVVHFVVGLFLIVLVLMQRTKEGGLGAAFGGGMTESLFGASSGNVLSRATVWGACIFFATSLTMAVLFAHMPRKQTEFERSLQLRPPIENAGTPTAPSSQLPVTGTVTPEEPSVPPREPVQPPAPAPEAVPAPEQPTEPSNTPPPSP